MSRIFKLRNNSDSSLSKSNPSSPRFVKSASSSHKRISLIVSLDRTLHEIATILQNRYGLDLKNCQYYLNDRIRLHGNWPLSAHCIQPSGMVQLLLEIKSMPTHVSSYRFTRLNVVDILSPDNEGDFADHSTINIKGRFSEAAATQPRRPNTAAGLNAIGPTPSSSSVGSDGPLNLDSSTDQGSVFISHSAVLQAFTAASRAIENVDCFSAATISSNSATQNLVTAPSNVCTTHVGTSQYCSNYPMVVERFAGVGADGGGRWTIDEHYHRLMRMNSIPSDPGQWNSTQVVMWINWASKHFRLVDKGSTNSHHQFNGGGDGGKLAKAFEGLSGKDLLSLSLNDLSTRFNFSGSTATPNLAFFTHFELLKNCREVCVPYKPQTQPYTVTQTSQRVYRQMGRSRVRTPRTGSGEFNSTGPSSSAYPGTDGNSVITRFTGGTGNAVTGLNGTIFSPSLPLSSNLRLNGGGFQSRISQPSAPSVQLSYGRLASLASSSSYFTSVPESLHAGLSTHGISLYSTGDGNTSVPTTSFGTADNNVFRTEDRIYPSFSSTSIDGNGASGSVRKYRVVSALSPPHHRDSGNITVPSLTLGGSGSQSSVVGTSCQVHLWQFLLELLTDWRHQDAIHWVNGDGEFILANPEQVASMWGQRKNKPAMNYEKLSRALRYYYDGDMIAKVQSKRFCYKFICDLKTLMGYSAGELHELVCMCAEKHGVDFTNGDLETSRKRPLMDGEAWFGCPSPARLRNTSSSMPAILDTMESDSTSAEVDVSPHFSRPEEEAEVLGEVEEDEDDESFEYCGVDDIDKVTAMLRMEADECCKIAEQKSRKK